MKLHKKLPVEFQGKMVLVDIEEWKRTGTKAPSVLIIHYNGHRIAPFEQRLRGWRIGLSALFGIFYSGQPVMKMLAMSNPFLDDLPFPEGFSAGPTEIRMSLPAVFKRARDNQDFS